MAYASQSDLLERITEITLVQLTDTAGSGQVNGVLVTGAIADAAALVDSLISPVYRVPLVDVPRVIRDHTATIAIYKLHLYRSADPNVWREHYLSALAFLQSVAAGKATLEGTTPEPSPSANRADTLDYQSEPRTFSRTDLKEW